MAIPVDSLIREPFLNRTRQEKVDIILAGKPRPDLKDLMTPERQFGDDYPNTRSTKFVIIFDKVSYDHVIWLTGCDIRQALFCWPCILFRSAHEDSWNKIGLTDLNDLGEKIKQHQGSLLHIQSMLDLQMFSSTIKVDKAPAPPIENKKIQRNRELAKRVIDVICYLVSQQNPPRIGSRDKNCLEVEDCLENLHFLRGYDFMQNTLIDEGVELIQANPKIITDMIDALTNTLKRVIQKELRDSTYVSVILSEHSPDRTRSQISIVLRYLKNGKVCERFVGFSNSEGIKTSKTTYQLISKIITDFQIYRRAIAYSLDGSILGTIQALSEVKQELKFCHPNIQFVPCYFHDLEDVLVRGLSLSPECDVLLSNIAALGSYFQEGANVCLKFNEIYFVNGDDDENEVDVNDDEPDSSCYNVLPRVVNRCDNYGAYLNIITTHRKAIIEKIDEALADPKNLSDTDAIKLKALRAFLSDFKNAIHIEILLKMFDVVAPLVESFKSPFPGAAFDITLIEHVLKSLSAETKEHRIDDFWVKIVTEFSESDNGEKHPNSFFEKKRNSLYRFLTEVAMSMKNQIKFRFEDAFKFGFCKMVDFDGSEISINSIYLPALNTYFGQFFDYKILENELKLVVGDKPSALNPESVHELYTFFIRSGLRKSFKNLYKLCEIVLALPSTIPDFKNRSSRTKLDEINSWAYPTTKQYSRDVSLLCIEQDFLKELAKKNIFYDEVMNAFQEINKTLELK